MNGQPVKRVAVWRAAVLPGSETFIRNQVSYTPGYETSLIGSVRIDSALSDARDTIIFDGGAIDRFMSWLFHRTGRSARVARALRDLSPDIVHAHFIPDAIMIRHALLRQNVPLLVTVHGHDITSWPRHRGVIGRIRRRQLRAVLSQATAVIAVSQFIRDELLRYGADPAKVRVAYIGIPVTHEGATDCTQVRPEPAWDVAFVGRFVEKKGVLDVLHVLETLKSNGTEVSAVMVGDGPLKGQVRAAAEEKSLNVSFTGALAPDAVRSVLSRARVFVAPSRTAANGDSEGFGMVFLEAGRAGLATAAYRHGGVVEAVLHGETGMLVAEGDVPALACTVAQLLDDPQLAHSLGAQACKRVVGEFDVRRLSGRLSEIYDEVLDASLR